MDSPRDPQGSGFPLIELIVLLVLLVVVGAIAIPGLMYSSGGSGERSPATSLKTLSTAEADFRANDRDWNHVNDFWTADVKGLYTMTSAAVRGSQATTTTDPAIKLIELSMASADADGTFFPAGGENSALSTFAVSSTKAGYWFAALDEDQTLPAGDPERSYRQDSGGPLPMGRVHNLSRFGFVTFPDSPSSGKYVFMVNENNTVFRAAVTGNPRAGTPTPPGLPAGYRHWPADPELNKSWSKLD